MEKSKKIAYYIYLSCSLLLLGFLIYPILISHQASQNLLQAEIQLVDYSIQTAEDNEYLQKLLLVREALEQENAEELFALHYTLAQRTQEQFEQPGFIGPYFRRHRQESEALSYIRENNLSYVPSFKSFHALPLWNFWFEIFSYARNWQILLIPLVILNIAFVVFAKEKRQLNVSIVFSRFAKSLLISGVVVAAPFLVISLYLILANGLGHWNYPTVINTSVGFSNYVVLPITTIIWSNLLTFSFFIGLLSLLSTIVIFFIHKKCKRQFSISLL